MECEIKKDKYQTVVISVTHNGRQWSTIPMYSFENLEKLRDEITEFLNVLNQTN